MKIGFEIPGCGSSSELDIPTRGEGRWSLNWMHILREEGHQLYNVRNVECEGQNLDWYFNTPWAGNISCFGDKVNYLKHGHLRYGAIKDEIWLNAVEQEHSNIRCLQNGAGNITFGYKNNYFDSLPAWAKAERNYNIGLMPIPFSDSMLTAPVTQGFDRPNIAWMSKEVFHRGQFERESPWPEVGLVFLRALEKFSRRVDFKLYFIITGEEQFPPEAQELLSRMNVETVPLLSFRPLLQFLSTIKINLGVCGMASSTIDSLFVRSVPLGHFNGFMTDTIRTEFPQGVLPPARETTEEQVYNLLETLWFDRKFYRSVEDCYQEEFSVHYKPNALKWFNSFVESSQ